MNANFDLKLNNLAHMEINEIRPFLANTMSAFTKISIAEKMQVDASINQLPSRQKHHLNTDSNHSKSDFDPLRAFDTSTASLTSDFVPQVFYNPASDLDSSDRFIT